MESYQYINEPRTAEEKLLKRCRDRFDYALREWRDIRTEGQKDMRYLAGDPWDDKEKAARKSEGRPAMVFDELNQYINQLINETRMNSHSVKVIPRGSGQNDKQAEVRGDIIRNVEYDSVAKAAYLCGFENAASRSYGYWRITRKYVDEKSFEQELCIKRIPNADNVLFDPDYKEADASDIRYAYVIEQMPHDEFKRKYPQAEVVDFSAELMQLCPTWIKDRDVQVAEYWEVETKPQKLLLVEGQDKKQITVTDKELKEMTKIAEENGVTLGFTVLKERKSEERTITQYITNGVEILETNEWDGKWIPIIGCFGKEMYVDYGKGPERVLMSLIRLARDPFMFYCYLRTCEAEESAMTPKVPFLGVEGQFEGHEDEWASVGKSPIAYLQYKAQTNNTGANVLGAPERNPFQPNFQAYEIAAEAARRAIQAAMGITNLPTAAQRQNDKSGVALQKIQSQQQKGSYHFVDNFLMSLEHSGRVMNDLLDKTYDTTRDVGTRKADGQYNVTRINDPQNDKAVDITGDPHDVTVSTGPSFESQREEAADFAETLAKVPGVFPIIGDLITKLRNLGPIGDEIAKRLTPPQFAVEDGQEPLPPQAIQQMQQLKQETTQLHAYAQKLEQDLTEAKQKEQAKVIDNQYKLSVADKDNQTKIAIAEIGAKTQDSITRLETTLKAWMASHGAAIDHIESETQRKHEITMQQQAANQQQEAAKQAAELKPQPTSAGSGSSGAASPEEG